MAFPTSIAALFKPAGKPRPTEWEKLLCGCACGAVLIILGLWGYGLLQHRAAVKPKLEVSMPPSLLNRASAFNFLLQPERIVIDKTHLFAWPFPAETVAKLVTRRNRATSPAPVNGTSETSPKTVPAAAAETASATPAAPPVPPLPPKPKAVCVIEYRGCMILSSGNRAALIHSPSGNVSAFYRTGEKISGIEIKSFTETELQTVSPTGKTIGIPFGGQAEIPLE